MSKKIGESATSSSLQFRKICFSPAVLQTFLFSLTLFACVFRSSFFGIFHLKQRMDGSKCKKKFGIEKQKTEHVKQSLTAVSRQGPFFCLFIRMPSRPT